MAILFELSESLFKQAALVAAKYPDRTIESVIEECFAYGVKSLYADAPKPVPPIRKEQKEYFNSPVDEERIDSITSIADAVSVQARQDIENMVCYSEEDVPESLGNPVLTSDGLFEL